MDRPPPSPPPRIRKGRTHTPQDAGFSEESKGNESDILAIECWTYEDAQPVNYKYDKMNEDELGTRLRGAGPLFLDKPPSAGLRLICRYHKTSVSAPFKETSFRAINEVLGLPRSHAYLSRPDAGGCGHYLGDPHNPVFIYHRSNNNGTISTVLKYDSASNITVGYILLGPRIFGEAEALRNAIISEFPSFSHPLLVPVVVTEFSATDLLKELTAVHQLLADVESATGYGDWKSAPFPISRKKCQQLAHDLGRSSCRFAFLEVAVQCTATVNDFTLQEIDGMKDYIAASRLRKLKGLNSSLKNRAEFLSNNLKHMQMFGGLSQRMQAMQNVMFNLVTQLDNVLNFEMARDSKEIASASKRDSSAMKIIAFLGTVFLPGTFISTFFAMPLFNWTASSMDDVMTDHFWIYWAVTLPLTVVITAVVVTFAIWQTRQNKAAAEKARNDAEDL